MDAATSRNATTGASRNLFFGAEDRRVGPPRPVGDEDKALAIVKTRRSQMAENVIATANNLANSVRTLRAYDRTGNTEQALGHIEATFGDLRRYTEALVAEVQAAATRDAERAAAELAAAAPVVVAQETSVEAILAALPKPRSAASYRMFQ